MQLFSIETINNYNFQINYLSSFIFNKESYNKYLLFAYLNSIYYFIFIQNFCFCHHLKNKW